ncbi:hypothetical protein K470DRAFT_260809 [Piedraia hortae CBS 480.64]|uniref:CENP-V/GFA domain-containing protein n=1 Tax=Piedraia hortae CBS 480.64 TaxID=1314780 RepID=A0A6A7BRQ3_9PEZI|nr:hypothetical protein K470DRAFT_260809 [Piedraia hortae CBS 480.64]
MCHCQNCKRRSGGLASYAFLIPKGDVQIKGTTHTEYADHDTLSGKPLRRSMCSACGSPVRIIEASQPETWCMQYGLFADNALPKPKLELFAKDACAWENKVGETVMETA